MTAIKTIVALVVVAVLGGGLFLYSGWYPMGADEKHYRLTHWVLETLRERAIARASRAVEVPDDLGSPERLLAGGADYNDMCVGCHLKPGMEQSDMSVGLYPAPPNLSVAPLVRHRNGNADDALLQRQFWVIKHGIKASGMPAWGLTHDDNRIWSMVAFLQKLPDLKPVQYQIITSRRNGGHHGNP